MSNKFVAVKRTKEKYEGVKDRLQKLEEVLKLFQLTLNQTQETCSVVMMLEAWEEAGYMYICSELCELGNLNDYLLYE